MTKQPYKYNNSPLLTDQNIITALYTLNVVAPFYSIRLKEINKALSMQIKPLSKARYACIVLFHLNKYARCLMASLGNLYQMHWRTIAPIINDLLDLGYITKHNTKRRTNIDALVNLTAYSITALGRSKVADLQNVLNERLQKLSK